MTVEGNHVGGGSPAPRKAPRPRGVPAALGLAIALTLSACDDTDLSRVPPGLQYSVDSSGVRIVESSAASVPVWTVDDEPAMVIGVIAGSRPYTFRQVASASYLDGGGIVIADAIDGEVRYFSSTGEHVRSVGGPGQGPGEFQVITGMVAFNLVLTPSQMR